MVRASQRDIARQAGVSEATVSRVLNGQPGVSATTTQTVLTAMDVLGFERPAALRRKSAGLVGLIIPELTNPIFPSFAQAIATALARAGYTAILCTQTPGGVHEDDYLQLLLDHGVAGIINISGLHADSEASPARYHRLLEVGLPLVLVNGHIAGLPALMISDDAVAAAELAVSHLADLGHERIGLATGPARFVPVRRKLAGFRDAMARHTRLRPAAVEKLVEHQLFTIEGGAKAAGHLMARGATAIVCASDIMALGAIQAVRGAGLRVPQEVSVVGYDDSLLVGFTDPPLTTIRQNVGAMSEAAVQGLLDVMAGSQSRHGEYLFRPELVVRGSTARRRARAVAARISAGA